VSTVQEVKDLIAAGKSHREIAAELGLSLSTISKYRNRDVVPENYTPDSSEICLSGEELFARWSNESRVIAKRKEEHPHDLVCVRVEKVPALLLVHGSDWHIGARGTDHDRLWRDLAGIAQAGGKLVLGGDLIDNPVKHKSHIVHSSSTPGEQVRALRYLLGAAQSAGVGILAGVSGNHENWTDHETGQDICGPIFRDLGIPYSPHQIRLVIHNGPSETRVLLRHKYRFKSQFDLGLQFRRMWEVGEWDFDIGMLGHTHDGPFVQEFTKHGVSRWASLAGSYKTVDGYGEEAGYNPAKTGMTAFVIEPSGLIQGFASLRAATVYMKGVKNDS